MSDRRFHTLIAAVVVLFVVMAIAGPSSCKGVWCLCTFDAQFWPYAPETARDYLKALSVEDLRRYREIVHPLDFVLPAALCFALREGARRWASPEMAGPLRALALVYAGVDYLENAAICVMLADPAGGFPDWVAITASALTSLKWFLLAAIASALGFALFKRRRV